MNPISSNGCRCCASYGSEEQKRAAANRLVRLQTENERLRVENESLRESNPAWEHVERLMQENERLRGRVKELESR